MVTGKRLVLNIISAVSAVVKMLYSTSLESIKTDKLINFMGQLTTRSSGKVFLAADNLKSHHSKKVTAWPNIMKELKFLSVSVFTRVKS
jgi:hypothetical protein